MLSIGLMSGTSMDGIDCALLETDGSSRLIKELGNTAISYEPQFKILLKATEYAIRKCLGNLNDAKKLFPQIIEEYLINVLQINQKNIATKMIDLQSYLQNITHENSNISLEKTIQHSTLLHAKAVQNLLQQTGYKAQQIDVVGYHGQTFFHQPAKKISIILGDGQYLSDLLGITVVNDFRSNDIEAGGQGAPLAPIYHQALAIRDKKIPAIVVNCGGIANVTIIQNQNELDLIGFDTGPGNALIDSVVRQRTQGKQHMDKDGQYAKSGTINLGVLAALYEKALIKDGENYFNLLPPKSLDYGDIQLIPELNSLSLEDACATLAAFTADSIIQSVQKLNKAIPNHWILAGGGWKNPAIREQLEARLINLFGNKMTVVSADKIGWNSQAMEAQLFAFLAVRSLLKKPLSVPGTTRVPKPMFGGKIYYAHPVANSQSKA